MHVWLWCVRVITVPVLAIHAPFTLGRVCIAEAVSLFQPVNIFSTRSWLYLFNPFAFADMLQDNGLVIGQPFVPTDPPKELGEEDQVNSLSENFLYAPRERKTYFC